MKKLILFLLPIVAFSGLGFSSALAQQGQTENNAALPAEAEPFVEAGKKAAAFAKADLNGDGTLDYVIILDEDVCREDDYYKTLKRTTVVVVRDHHGKLSRAARNEEVVFCRNCPDGYEDGFADIVARENGFTIWNTVGKDDRTVFKYSFVYSRPARTWRLERFEKSDYNISTNRVRTKVFNTPRDFAPINFADLNPEKFTSKVESSRAPEKKPAARSKTRAVDVYLLEHPENDRMKPPQVVRAKRRVDARTPLAGAIKEMLAMMTENKDTTDLNNYLFRLQFVSASIKKETARLDFKYEQDTEFDWLWEMHPFFPEIVEKTALQFPNVKRILLCINGYEQHENGEGFYSINCDEEWRKK